MDRGMQKIIIITRKTRLQELVYQYNTAEQAKFYLEHMGIDFSDYIKEDTVYQMFAFELPIESRINILLKQTFRIKLEGR